MQGNKWTNEQMDERTNRTSRSLDEAFDAVECTSMAAMIAAAERRGHSMGEWNTSPLGGGECVETCTCHWCGAHVERVYSNGCNDDVASDLEILGGDAHLCDCVPPADDDEPLLNEEVASPEGITVAEGDEIITYADVLDQADTGDPAGFMAAAGIDSVSGDVFSILRYDDLCTPETNAGYTQIYYEDSNTREATFNLPDDYDDIRKIAAAAAIELFECDLSCNDINGIRIPNMCVAVSNEDIDEMIAAAEKFIQGD